MQVTVTVFATLYCELWESFTTLQYVMNAKIRQKFFLNMPSEQAQQEDSDDTQEQCVSCNL